MPAPETDVLIHGAGPVGCALALALRGTGLRVAVFDKTSFAAPFRPIALSYASRLILERVGAWQTATPIETIHVSQAGGFGHARLEAADAGVPALGYVMDYSTLAASLRSQVEEFITKDEVAAKCVVHAEGAAPEAEEKRYAQDAVVALVQTDLPAHSAAFERFTPEGPLALLPFDGRYAMVWSRRPEKARALAAAPEAEFLAELGAAPGRRAGAEPRPARCLGPGAGLEQVKRPGRCGDARALRGAPAPRRGRHHPGHRFSRGRLPRLESDCARRARRGPR